MKKIVKLIDSIQYDYKYLAHKKSNGETHYLDGDNVISKNLSLDRITYSSEDIVNITDELISISNEITEKFKNTFISRGREATKEQIYFAEETARIALGEFKEKIICVDPAPCGFGKSTIKLELMKYFTKQYEENSSNDGIIIVGDRLADLKQLQKDLGDYSKYTFLLESWNEDVCQDKSIKFAKSNICKQCRNTRCKIKKQKYEQDKYPILLITNARLQQFGEMIGNQYKKWEHGERKLLLIDERPQIMNVVKVSKGLMNEIDTAISNLEYEELKEKTEFLAYWKEISNMVENKMTPLRLKYKRFIISNNSNIDVCMDNEPFMRLWQKYMKYDYHKELEHIHTILTKGGFYVCEKNKEFISTIGCRNLRDDYMDFKTIIFDGSALYDPQYISMYKYDKETEEDKSELKFLYIPNSRTYENLDITVYTAHKVSKTEFKNKEYLVKAVAEYINNKVRTGFNKSNYVVTYKEQASQVGNLLGETLKNRIPKSSEGKSYYFGNTKGSNSMEECTRMFQIGWDTLPDYEVAIMWLSCKGVWDKLLELCLDTNKAITYSELLMKANRSEENISSNTYSAGRKNYCFGLNEIDNFQYLDTVSKFYQEIHRTKLRDYNYTGKISVYLFQTKPVIYEMIKKLLPKCNFKTDKNTLPEFQKAKDYSFKKADGSKTAKQKILDFFYEWDGNEIKVTNICTACDITSKRWEKLKKEPSIKNILDGLDKSKKGYYSRIS